jgi:hypothetical protein
VGPKGTIHQKPNAMRLFFLLIPFIGINCFMKCFHEKKTTPAGIHSAAASNPIMPSCLLIQFN